MASFSRRSITQAMNQKPTIVESLEDRCLLSASLGRAAFAAPARHPAIHVNAPRRHGLGLVGTVVSTDSVANTITVSSTDKSGATTQTTYTLASDATITADGKTIALSDLTAGVKVAIKSSVAAPTVATSIHAIGKEAEGTVTAVDTAAGTLTLTDRKGVSTTYTVGSATITSRGTAITLADVAVGSGAELKFSALSPTTLLNIEVRPARTARAGRAAGTVVSVDTAANTVTVSSTNKAGTTTQTTYTFAPGATITADGKAITLSQLTAGMNLAIRTAPGTPTVATSITVIAKHVAGRVTAVDTTAGTITLANKDGTTATYNVSGATITRRHKTITLADVVVGSVAEIQYSALDPTTPVKVSIGGGHHRHR